MAFSEVPNLLPAKHKKSSTRLPYFTTFPVDVASLPSSCGMTAICAQQTAGVDLKLPLQSETVEGLGLLLSACSADA
jgi:hypothetical protein